MDSFGHKCLALHFGKISTGFEHSGVSASKARAGDLCIACKGIDLVR